MQIADNLIVRNRTDEDRRRTIACQEMVLTLPEEEVLILRKNNLHWRATKEIGDGMAMIYVTQRPFVTYELDLQAFVAGLTIYHEYDEVKDLHHTYLYKFPKGAPVELLNQLCSAYEIDLDVTTANRFVELTGKAVQLWDPDELLRYLKTARVQALLSFLFGLVAGYGQLRYEEDVLHHAIVQVPRVGSTIQYQSLIGTVLDLLEDHGIFTVRDELHEGATDQLQISIGDWEVLYHIDKWYGSIFPFTTVSKRDHLEQIKQEVVSFLEAQGAEQSLLETINYSVLKTVQK